MAEYFAKTSYLIGGMCTAAIDEWSRPAGIGVSPQSLAAIAGSPAVWRTRFRRRIDRVRLSRCSPQSSLASTVVPRSHGGSVPLLRQRLPAGFGGGCAAVRNRASQGEGAITATVRMLGSPRAMRARHLAVEWVVGADCPVVTMKKADDLDQARRAPPRRSSARPDQPCRHPPIVQPGGRSSAKGLTRSPGCRADRHGAR